MRKWWHTIHKQQLARDFLHLSSSKGKEWDSYQAAQACHRRWGIPIDWHEFAYALDFMREQGKAEVIRSGYIKVYRVQEVTNS